MRKRAEPAASPRWAAQARAPQAQYCRLHPEKPISSRSHRLSLARNSTAVTAQYTINGDYRNLDLIPPQSTTTFYLYADVSSAATSGSVDATATIETFHPSLLLDQQTTQTTTFALANTTSGG